MILYANENIPCKPLTGHPVFSDLELMAFELHQSKRKWLLIGIYKPPSQNVIEFLNRMSLVIDHYLQTYENILAIGDFNLSVDNSHLEAFIQAYDFGSLIKKPTRYQSNTPSCIDLILTNRKSLFKLSNTFQTGLSDHHKLVCTILKSRGFKGAPIEKIYRSYKTFDVSNFKNTLKIELEKVKSESYGEFEAVFLKEPNKHAPLKKKFIRHNNNPFMTKDLRNQIMVRSKLKNFFNKNRHYGNWCKYKRQRNLCLNLLRKTKKSFYENLDEKQVSDNKVFWEKVRPSFSDKGANCSKINLVEKNSIIVDEKKIANIMINYFINITKILRLKTLNKSQIDKDKFENHIRIKKIHETFPEIIPGSFHFEQVSSDIVLKEIQNLNIIKIINIWFNFCVYFKTMR